MTAPLLLFTENRRRARRVRGGDPTDAGTLYRSRGSRTRRAGRLVGHWAAAALLGLFVATAGLVTGVALLVFTTGAK